jgi:hypothetical protein
VSVGAPDAPGGEALLGGSGEGGGRVGRYDDSPGDSVVKAAVALVKADRAEADQYPGEVSDSAPLRY